MDATLLADEESLNLKMPANMMAEPVQAATAPAAPAPSVKRLPGEKVAIQLKSSLDPIFAGIRDLSIEGLGPFLRDRSIRIKQLYSKFRENKDASITEIHDFVKKIPQLTREYKLLSTHINIAELIKSTTDTRDFRQQWQMERGILEGEAYLDTLEFDLVACDVERFYFLKYLRLLCLISLTSNGIKTARLDSIRRLFVHVYGFQHMFTVANLEKAGEGGSMCVW